MAKMGSLYFGFEYAYALGKACTKLAYVGHARSARLNKRVREQRLGDFVWVIQHKFLLPNYIHDILGQMQVLGWSWSSEPAGAERLENKLACKSNPQVASQTTQQLSALGCMGGTLGAAPQQRRSPREPVSFSSQVADYYKRSRHKSPTTTSDLSRWLQLFTNGETGQACTPATTPSRRMMVLLHRCQHARPLTRMRDDRGDWLLTRPQTPIRTTVAPCSIHHLVSSKPSHTRPCKSRFTLPKLKPHTTSTSRDNNLNRPSSCTHV
jgi:hypothetical protein